MYVKRFIVISILLGSLFFLGCEKDNEVVLPFYNLESGAELLQYLESSGDIVNNNRIPFFSADELFNVLNSVLVIDVRKDTEYVKGHINGALNIQPSMLLDSLDVINTSNKIVLVSSTGEASAFYALLLRIAGFNVYTLKFGMASWHSDFASVWLNRIVSVPFGPTYFTTEEKFQSLQFQLPDPKLEGEGSIQSKVNNKIKKLLVSGFVEEAGALNSVNSVEYINIADYLSEYYIICAGPGALYYSKLYGTYHLMGAVNYLMHPWLSHFRTTSYLQTIPDKQKLLIYSGSGQESAFVTAYLNLLGYNAYSILLGANSFSYNMIGSVDELRVFQFNNSVIRNYPYIK